MLVNLRDIQNSLEQLKAAIDTEDYDSANGCALSFDSIIKEFMQGKELIDKDLELVLEDFSQLVFNLQEKQKSVGKDIVKLKRKCSYKSLYNQLWL